MPSSRIFFCVLVLCGGGCQKPEPPAPSQTKAEVEHPTKNVDEKQAALEKEIAEAKAETERLNKLIADHKTAQATGKSAYGVGPLDADIGYIANNSSKEAGLADDPIKKVLGAYAGPLKNCRGGQAGDLTLKFTINPDGSVSSVSASGPLAGTPVEVCAVGKTEKMRFRKSDSPTEVTHNLPDIAQIGVRPQPNTTLPETPQNDTYDVDTTLPKSINPACRPNHESHDGIVEIWGPGDGGPNPCHDIGDDTRKVLGAYAGPLKQCRGGQEGALLFDFKILPDGTTSDVKVIDSLMQSPVEVCAVELFKKMRFPKSDKTLRVRHALP